jgi:branched-chain amino acid transport system substrate-binding protein
MLSSPSLQSHLPAGEVFVPDTLIPGSRINTSASDFAPIEQLQMMQFKGGKWELFGDIINAEAGG